MDKDWVLVVRSVPRFSDFGEVIIGVASDLENAKKLVDEYYGGKFKVYKSENLDFPRELLEYVSELDDSGNPISEDLVTYDWYQIDKL